MAYRLFLFLISLVIMATTASADMPVNRDKVFPGADAPTNYVKNPSCEKNTADITDADAIVTTNSTTPLTQNGDCAIDADADTEYAEWDVDGFEEYNKNGNCEAKITYKGDASDYDFEVYTSTTENNSVSLLDASSGGPKTVALNFPCGDLTNDPKPRVTSTAAGAAAINVAKVYIGEATNVGSVAQAEVLVDAELTSSQSGLTSGSWSTFIPNNVVKDVYGAYNSSTGEFTVPFNSNVCVNVNMEIGSETYAVGDAAAIALYVDGSEVKRVVDKRMQGAGTYPVPLGTGEACLNDLTTGQVVTVRVYNDHGTTWTISGAFAARSFLQIKTIPTASEQVQRVGHNDLSGFAKHPPAALCSFVFNGASMASASADSDCSTPSVEGNISAPDTKIPGFVADNLLPGNYLVLASGGFLARDSSSGTQSCFWEIHDGTNSGGISRSSQLVSKGRDFVASIQGQFTYTSKQTDKQFEIRGYRGSGNADCLLAVDESDLTFTLVPLTQQLPAPLLKNSVTTSSEGVSRFSFAEVRGSTAGSVCSSSPCTIGTSTGDITVTRSGAGTYVASFTENFPTPPVCTCNAVISGSNKALCSFDPPTVSGISTIQTYNISAITTPVDGYFSLDCKGAN